MTPCSAVTTADSGAAVAAATGSGSIGREVGRVAQTGCLCSEPTKLEKLCYQPCNCQAKADDFRLWTERDTDASGDTMPPWGLPRAFWARQCLRMIATAVLGMN